MSPGYKVLYFSTTKSWFISILAGLDCKCLWCELTWVRSWSRSLKILCFLVSLSVWLWLTIWKSTGASGNHMHCFKLCLFQCGDPAHRNVAAYEREHHNVNTWDTPNLSKTAVAVAPGWVPWVQIEDAVGLWQMVCSTSNLVISHANMGKICLVWFSWIATRHQAFWLPCSISSGNFLCQWSKSCLFTGLFTRC